MSVCHAAVRRDLTVEIIYNKLYPRNNKVRILVYLMGIAGGFTNLVKAELLLFFYFHLNDKTFPLTYYPMPVEGRFYMDGYKVSN